MKFQKAIEALHATAIKMQILSEMFGAGVGYLWWIYETPQWPGPNALLCVGIGGVLGWVVGRILSRSYYNRARILMDYDR